MDTCSYENSTHTHTHTHILHMYDINIIIIITIKMVLPKMIQKDDTQNSLSYCTITSSGWSDNDGFSSVNESVLCYSLKWCSCLVVIQSSPDGLGLVRYAMLPPDKS